MRLFGRTLSEYFSASRVFLIIIIALTMIVVVLRIFSDLPSSIQLLFSLFGIIFMGLAGWSVVRNHGFNLHQAVAVGILLSVGIHWTLPIFHSVKEVFFLLLLNTMIYSVIVFIGAWLATKSKKRRC